MNKADPEIYGTFDFIIIGAGSAGAVLAERLSQDGRNTVLVLEAGKHYRNPLYSMPMIAARLFSRRDNNWFYNTVPQKYLNNRPLFLPRGKMVGGSFIFNGTQYVRGHRSDFDRWSQQGNRGWSYSEVLPYFKRSEDWYGGENELHGSGGRLPVVKASEINPITQACLKAAKEAGYEENDDFNGYYQDGFGTYDFNLRNGRRCTTAIGFLYPALKRPNLSIAVSAHTTRIVVENSVARAVEFEHGGTIKRAIAKREVILSAGAFNTPQLLMLSGIGDAGHLSSIGIAVSQHLPGVGQNLQDHLNIVQGYECLQPVSMMQSLRIDRLVKGVLDAQFRGRGVVARSPLEAGGFFRTRAGLAAPDIQAMFIPISSLKARIWFPGERGIRDTFGCYVWQNRPESRGEILLKSADYRDEPLIDPNYLSAEIDRITTRVAVREMRRIVRQPAMDAYRGIEFQPGEQVQSDEQIDEFIRQNAGTCHHSCGTARMGPGQDAVVDDTLRVRGIQSLRIADASIMPHVVSGNTNAATIMIAEKASDLILGRSLPAEDVAEPAYFEAQSGVQFPSLAMNR